MTPAEEPAARTVAQDPPFASDAGPAAGSPAGTPRTDAGPRLGVLVPCRNEAAVLGRKLRNLARLDWPAPATRHRVVIVDDGSEDGTAERAGALLDELFTDSAGPTARVVTNDRSPGKVGAMIAGLAALGEAVDVVVLTDADVVLRADALTTLAAAFARSPTLGMACGSQEFVRDLADDGSPTGADGGAPVPAPGRYDRWTAAVRALESRWGRLFSVHGQLLAWRRDLELAPAPGIAADDLDLMAQVRARGLRIEKLDGARFLERKTPPGPDRRDQEQRRAAAYFQVIDRCRLPRDASWADRLHFGAYRWLPGLAPWLVPSALLAIVALAFLRGGTGVGAVTAALVTLGVLSPPGRRLLRLLIVIARSRRHAGRLGDRWEMARR